MSNLNEQDIAEYLDNNSDVMDNLTEWSKLITELSEKEIALYKWKEIYSIKSLEIENTTDFKTIYSKNNDKIRKEHIKNELSDWHANIKELEFSIDWISHRISFLKQLIHTKTILLEVKE